MSTHLSDKTTRKRDSVGTTAGRKGAALREKIDGWPGYVRNGVFVIEKKVHGVKFHVSTRATTLRAAMQHLARFETDPQNYQPLIVAAHNGLVMTEELIDEFHAWHQLAVTREWALTARRHLIDWANHFAGADVRRLTLLEHLKPHLRGKRSIAGRVKALKAFTSWLRTEKGLLTRSEDATLDLAVPVSKPTQQTRTKAVLWETVVAVAEHLPHDVRDVLVVLAATGWHISEIRRFATSGSIRERVASDGPDVLAVIGAQHKSGKRHFTALQHHQHVEAAKRIRVRGHVYDKTWLRKVMLRACEAADAAAKKHNKEATIPAFTLGVMRHSVATWLRQAGVPDEASAQFLGHSSAATTRRHYIAHEVAPRVLPPTALRVVGE